MKLHYQDPEQFILMKEKIIADGIEKLHIVSDFDKTLTKFIVDGKKVNTSFSIFREEGIIEEPYATKAYELYNKYFPIEQDGSLSIEKKTPYMKTWWEKHMQLLIDEGVTQEHVDIVTDHKKDMLRDKCAECIQWSEKNHVPFLIFTAGISNVVEQVLVKNNLHPQNLQVIGNTILFNAEGDAKGYNPQLIHVYNKKEGHINASTYKNHIEDRTNIIIIGDSIGDDQMADGIQHETVLKIGIFNEGDDERLQDFIERFDLVVSDTNDLQFLEDILKEIA